MGTPAYMSPELCRGEPQDYRSDIYSLGVLFFEMATGQLPFQANGMIEMAMKHANAPMPSARRLNPQVPDALEQLIHKMTAKSPNDRYQSTSDIVDVLDDLIFELRVNKLGLRNKSTSGKSKLTGENTIVEANAKAQSVKADSLKGQNKANSTVLLPPIV